MRSRFIRILICIGSALLPSLCAQSATLALSSAEAPEEGTVTLELSFQSDQEKRPVALEWTFRYPQLAIKNIEVDNGPAIADGKAIFCDGDATAYKCLIVGTNRQPIANGIVARVTVALARGTAEVRISIEKALGTSAQGQPLSVSATGGTIRISTSQRAPGRRR